MTLLIALPTVHRLHVAVDARLSSFNNRGTLVKWIDSSPKHVDLRFSGLGGFVAWTGVGAIDGVDTADWVADVLRPDVVGKEPSLDVVLETLAAGASLFHRHLNKDEDALTFLVGALEGGRPILAMVSNREPLHGTSQSEHAGFTISIGGWKRRVVVAGSGRDDVSPADMAVLRGISKHRWSYRQGGSCADEWDAFVGGELRDLIARVARSQKEKKKEETVSPTSNYWRMDLNGGISGSGNAPFAPTAGTRQGNVIGDFLFLNRKRERGEITAEEMNEELMRFSGYTKKAYEASSEEE